MAKKRIQNLFVNKSFSFYFFITLLSGILTAGIIISIWNFQIFSFKRLLLTALPVFPVVLLITLGFFIFVITKYQSPFNFIYSQKRIIISISICAIISLSVISKNSDVLHVFSTWFITTLFFWLMFTLLVFINNITKTTYTEKTIVWLLACLAVIGYSIFVYSGFFARMYGEDHCYYLLPLQQGFIKALWNFYISWSGRLFAYSLIFTFVGIKGVVAFELLFIFLVLVVLLKIFLADENNSWEYSICITAFLLFFIFSATPDIYKGIYWVSPSFYHLPVIILLPAYIFFAWYFGTKNVKKKLFIALALGFTLPFFAGLSHESNTVPFVLLTILLAGLAFLSPRMKHFLRLRAFTIAGIIGSVSGLAVEVFSPGNHARHIRQGYPIYPSFLDTVKQILSYFWTYLSEGRLQIWILLLAFLLGLLLKKRLSRKIYLAGIPFIISVIMAIFAFLPSAFAMSDTLPYRTQLIPTTYLFFGAFFSGVLCPRFSDVFIRNFSFACICFVLVCFSLELSLKDRKIISPMQEYAQAWDLRYQAMVNGEKLYTINIPWESSEQELICVERYYDYILTK